MCLQSQGGKTWCFTSAVTTESGDANAQQITRCPLQLCQDVCSPTAECINRGASCSDWLKQKEGDTDTPSTGLLLPQKEDPSMALIEACFEVVTSGEKGAATDSEVRLQLSGSSGDTSWLTLAASHDTFERGCTDTFDKLQVEEVGTMSKLKVRPLWCSPSDDDAV